MTNFLTSATRRRLVAEELALCMKIGRLASEGRGPYDFDHLSEDSMQSRVLLQNEATCDTHRLLTIQQMLSGSQVAPTPTSFQRAQLGHMVTRRVHVGASDPNPFEDKVIIVGEGEAEIVKDSLIRMCSNTSVIGRSLIGKSVGDEVSFTLRGVEYFAEILKIELPDVLDNAEPSADEARKNDRAA